MSQQRLSEYDPGVDVARARAAAAQAAMPVHGRHRVQQIRVGTASWTDRTLTARGVFYPTTATSAEARLRYYASQLSMVEVDSTYYALPAPQMSDYWVERTPAAFVFDVKAFALMTGHPGRN